MSAAATASSDILPLLSVGFLRLTGGGGPRKPPSDPVWYTCMPKQGCSPAAANEGNVAIPGWLPRELDPWLYRFFYVRTGSQTPPPK